MDCRIHSEIQMPNSCLYLDKSVSEAALLERTEVNFSKLYRSNSQQKQKSPRPNSRNSFHRKQSVSPGRRPSNDNLGHMSRSPYRHSGNKPKSGYNGFQRSKSNSKFRSTGSLQGSPSHSFRRSGSRMSRSPSVYTRSPNTGKFRKVHRVSSQGKFQNKGSSQTRSGRPVSPREGKNCFRCGSSSYLTQDCVHYACSDNVCTHCGLQHESSACKSSQA